MAVDKTKLGDTEFLISTGHAVIDHQFPEPPKKVDQQEFLTGNGAKIVNSQYANSTRKIHMEIEGATKDSLLALISGIAGEIAKIDVDTELILEYRAKDATNSSFSTVLDGWYKTDFDWGFVHNEIVNIWVTLICEPTWDGAEQTIALQALSVTPSVVTIGTVLGDVDTDCIVTIDGKTNDFGSKIYLGTRATPMTEANYNPIKGFGGNAEAGTFGGEYFRKTVTTAWTNITGGSDNLNGGDMKNASPGVGVGVGDGGKIFTTDNDWATSSDIAHGLTAQNLNDVTYAGGDVWYACGDGGVILKAVTDPSVAGNWSALSSGITNDLLAIDSASTTVVWACSAPKFGSSKIVGTTDGSAWSTQSTLSGSASFTGISAFDTTNAYAVRDSGAVRRTTDGSTWVSTGLSPTANALYGVSAIGDADTAWVCGELGEIWKTVNGSTWTQQTSDAAVTLYDIEMFDTSDGWACGDHGTIIYTDDGGSTDWTEQTFGVSATLNSIAVIGANDVNIVGDGFTILDTVDAGTAWTLPAAGWTFSSVSEWKQTARILARVRTADSTPASVQMRVSSGFGGGTVRTNDPVNLANSANFQWVDLGVISIPIIRLSEGVDPTPIVTFEAKGTGSATFDLDVAVAIATDGEVIFIDAAATDAVSITLDSSNDAVNKGNTSVEFRGSPPRLHPGVNNWATAETNAINPCDITITYKPQYLSPVA